MNPEFITKLYKEPIKNVETDDILDILENGYSYEAERKLDRLVGEMKKDYMLSGFEWGKFSMRG